MVISAAHQIDSSSEPDSTAPEHVQRLLEAYRAQHDGYMNALEELGRSTAFQDVTWDELQADTQGDTSYRRFIEARRRWIEANRAYLLRRNLLEKAIRDRVEACGLPATTPRLSDYGLY
jgi:hypothetical protein